MMALDLEVAHREPWRSFLAFLGDSLSIDRTCHKERHDSRLRRSVDNERRT